MLELSLTDRYWAVNKGIPQLVAVFLKLEIEDIEVSPSVLRANHWHSLMVVVSHFMDVSCHHCIHCPLWQGVQQYRQVVLVTTRLLALLRTILMFQVRGTPSAQMP